MDPRAILERFRRRQPIPTDLADAIESLGRLARNRPDLEGPARSLTGLLGSAFLVTDTGSTSESELAEMARGWTEGIPAFRHLAPRLDEAALIARARGIAKVIGGQEGSATGSALALQTAIRRRRVDLPAWARAVLAGHPEEVELRAEEGGLDTSMAASVLRLALLPALARVSALLDRIRSEASWDRGDCPNCGSRPLLAESRGLEQRIYYRCGLCAADWPGERLRCPSCGESSPKSLHYSFVEGEQERHRLAHCDACLYDWKVVSTLSPLSPPGLIVADLATIHLEILAAARGSHSA